MPDLPLLAVAFLVLAALYASVGHAGGSGYLAAMALAGAAPETMKPTALALNILVASITTWNFRRAGQFHWRAIWPFAVASVPAAFAGGLIQLPGREYRVVTGVVLALAALRLLASLLRPSPDGGPPEPRVPLVPALAAGTAIGLLAGLTGTGGGIFLSPLVVLMGWADVRQTAGITASFILLNSAAGLAGNLSAMGHLPPELPLLALAAGVGGFVGSLAGARHLPQRPLKGLLVAVLLIASAKLIAL